MKIGIDIVEIQRLREKLSKNPALTNKLFSEEEIKYCRGFSDPYPHFAGTFASKEAFIKTLGKNPGWLKIEIRRQSDIPHLFLNRKKVSGSLSISHTNSTAVAVFLLLE